MAGSGVFSGTGTGSAPSLSVASSSLSPSAAPAPVAVSPSRIYMQHTPTVNLSSRTAQPPQPPSSGDRDRHGGSVSSGAAAQAAGGDVGRWKAILSDIDRVSDLQMRTLMAGRGRG